MFSCADIEKEGEVIDWAEKSTKIIDSQAKTEMK